MIKRLIELLTAEGLRGKRTKIIVLIMGLLDEILMTDFSDPEGAVYKGLAYLGVIALVDKFPNKNGA